MQERRTLNRFNPDPVTGKGFIDNYEVVDLGLPSGTLWATYDVGASEEGSAGDYYWYGGSIKCTTGGNMDYYVGTDNPLPEVYDTATQIMGLGWRMPTQQQVQELIDNTTLVSGIVSKNNTPCVRFNSNIKSGACIYFPAIGNWYNGTITDMSNACYIWTSSTNDNQYAYYFTSSGSTRSINTGSKVVGFAVRGVHSVS